MRDHIRAYSGGKHLQYYHHIANVHRRIKIAGFDLKAQAAIRTNLINPLMQSVSLAGKHLAHPALRAAGMGYR